RSHREYSRHGTRKRRSFVPDCRGVREPSDRDLVRKARRGDRDAAAALFRRYWRDAWRAAFAITGRRSLADDVAADGFERAFAALGRFDDRRPFGPWLHRIVANRALDVLRAERRLSDEELPETPDRAFSRAAARVAGGRACRVSSSGGSKACWPTRPSRTRELGRRRCTGRCARCIPSPPRAAGFARLFWPLRRPSSCS